MKVLIVGGVAGGASAATRLRRLDETAEIIMFEKGEYISFANCGLPYHIGETIKERNKLLLQTPEAMKNRFNIDVRVNSEVIGVDSKRKVVKVLSKNKGEYEESYDKLVLAPGAKPIRPNIVGIESDKIYTLRNVPDMDRIKKVVDEKGVQSAIVIGGGFIGIETAENLRERGLHVTLVEAAPQIIAPVDAEMANIATKELEDHGIGVILNNGVKAFADQGNQITVTLQNEEQLIGEMVILAIGVTPDTAFLRESGIELSERGHILTNKAMETSDKAIYAVGDAILVKDWVNGSDSFVPLAGPANRQGRIVADQIAGKSSTYPGTMGTSILKIFDLVVAATGNNSKTLDRMGIPYEVAYLHPMSHASYYPGASQITMKLLYGTDGKVLGAQATGYEGVDKAIDVIATVMKFNGTVEALTELELAYAPPFLSAKSPANMAGFIAENHLKGVTKTITPQEAEKYDSEKQILLDVRDDVEVQRGMIPGAIHIPLNSLRDRLAELDKDKEIIIYCAVGQRGHTAARLLTGYGYQVKNMTGGYKMYQMIHYKAKGDIADTKTATEEKKTPSPVNVVKEVDATGLCCPGPITRMKQEIDGIATGEVIRITSSDVGFFEDARAWCKSTGNQLLSVEKDKGIVAALVKKCECKEEKEMVCSLPYRNEAEGKTMVVFSGDLDKAIASFIIANGAAAMGKKVTMFFTFWGLNVLRREDKIKVEKNLIEKAFGMMMPRGSKKLQLSKMNMGGMGAQMIRGIMKNKNIQSLEDLIKQAIENGVEIVACTMSMDVMGIKEEELIPGVKLGGVGYYLGEAENANVNLFI